MKTILSFLICLAVANTSFGQAVETEPNDIPQKANKMSLNGTASGNIDPQDVDWWKFTTHKDGKISITLNNPDQHSGLYVALYDKLGTVILGSTGVGNGSHGFDEDGLAAGTYYVQVKGYTGHETTTLSYTLSSGLTPPDRKNDNEPNDSKENALTLKLNDSAIGHIGYYYNNRRDSADWYKLITNEDGKIKLILDNTGNSAGSIFVYLFDADGKTQLASVGADNYANSFVKDGLAAGTYYVKIAGIMSAYSHYKIIDSLFTTGKANDQEPNDSKNKAKKLDVNSSTTGHIGYYNNNRRDSADWYKIRTVKDGMLKLTLDNTGNTSGTIYLYLYDGDGKTLLSSIGADNYSNSFSKDALAAGTYYVKVWGLGSAFSGYKIIDSLKTYTYNTDAEPNDHPYEADTMLVGEITTGHLLFSYNNHTDNEDWFKLEYTGKGQMSFTVKNEPAKINHVLHGFHMDFYKDTLQSPVYAESLSSATNTFKIPHGKYYVRVYPFNGANGPSSYSVKIRVPNGSSFDDVPSTDTENQPALFSWNISGNASQNNCAVQLNLTENANIIIRVISLNGNPVQLINKGNLPKGNYTIPLNFYNAISGMYIVNVISGNTIESKNVMK